MGRICAVNLAERLSKEIMQANIAKLNKWEQKHILRFIRWEDRQRSLLGRLLIRWILKKYYGFTDFSRIKKDNYNRPFLYDFANLDFNISHSGLWIVCGISKIGRIGMDVELIKPIDLSIANRFFAIEEKEYLFALPENEQLKCFFHFWTLKESYIKALGNTFKNSLDQFWFDISNPDKIKLYVKNLNDKGNWQFKSFFFESSYIVSVCMPDKSLSYKSLSDELEYGLEIIEQNNLL